MKKVSAYLPAMAWAALIFFLSSRESLPDFMGAFAGMDKVVHAGFYGIFAAWLLYGAHGPGAPRAWFCAAVASVYGVTDEVHQYFVVGRSCDAVDWLADTFGATLCVALWLRWRAQQHARARETHAADL